MSGILIYYWAKLWMQQSIELIDNTDLPLLFHSRSSHSEAARDAILSITKCLTHCSLFLDVCFQHSRGVCCCHDFELGFSFIIVPIL